jgi:hypothetical protein
MGTQPISIKPVNECAIVTLFPMTAICNTTNPSSPQSYDGAISLMVSGGTPPYNITWEEGGSGPTKDNLGVGDYHATIVDFYGDFTANTICSLTATTTTSTTSTSTTTLPPYGDLCMYFTDTVGANSETHQFLFNGYLNGKPTWISDDDLYNIYWSTGTTSQWLVDGWSDGIIYNSNTSVPPLTGWQFLGGSYSGTYTITVSEGDCVDNVMINLSINRQSPTCGHNGSIIITANGGSPAYQYSINGGTTYQSSPVFTNLSGGVYSVKVKDSNNVTTTQTVTLLAPPPNQTYEIALVTTGPNSFNVTVTPTLPVGASITFDLKHTSIFKVAPSPTVAVYNNVVTLIVNGSPIATPSPMASNSVAFNPCDSGSIYTKTNVTTWNSLTFNSTTTVSGTFTDTISPITPLVKCYYVNGSSNGIISKAILNNCECCNLTIKNPAKQQFTERSILG